jgi:hypothetical protein
MLDTHPSEVMQSNEYPNLPTQQTQIMTLYASDSDELLKQNLAFDCFRTGIRVQTEPAGSIQQTLWPTERAESTRTRPQPTMSPEEEPDRVGMYKIYNDVERWPFFRAGRVSSRVDIWNKYTSDRIMLHELRGFGIEFDQSPHQNQPCRELSLNQKEMIALREEIQTLLEKEVITKVTHTPGEFISNVFLREKKDPGKYRMILNLTDLNEFVTYRKFKMDTFETALTLIETRHKTALWQV